MHPSRRAVNTLVTYNPITVSSQASVVDACRLMQENDMRHLPVVDDDYRVVGIVSDFDAARTLRSAAVEDAPSSQPICVGSIMTRAVVSVGPDSPPGEALALMLSRRFHSIPILDDGRLCGIVTTTDYLREFAELLPAEARRSVSSAMSVWRPTVEVGNSPREVRRQLAAEGAVYAGVVDDGRPLGVVSARRLEAALACDFVGDPALYGDDAMLVAEVARVGDLLPAGLGIISPKRTLGEAAALVSDSRRDGLAVVVGDSASGMITEGDLLRLLASSLT